jgi:hypothetical protein
LGGLDDEGGVEGVGVVLGCGELDQATQTAYVVGVTMRRYDTAYPARARRLQDALGLIAGINDEQLLRLGVCSQQETVHEHAAHVMAAYNEGLYLHIL